MKRNCEGETKLVNTKVLILKKNWRKVPLMKAIFLDLASFNYVNNNRKWCYRENLLMVLSIRT